MNALFTPLFRLFSPHLRITTLLGLMLILVGSGAKAQNFDIGTGTIANSSTAAPSPYGAFFSGQRAQYLYKASELTAAGMTPGNIDGLGWNVVATNGSGNHGQFTIKIQPTTITSLTAWQTLTNQVYYNATGVTPVMGYNMYTIGTPVVWNGTDNIIVEVCHWNGTATYTYNASVPGTSVANTSLYYWADYSGPFCGNNTLYTTSTSTRPNIRFVRNLPPCAGQPIAGSVSPAQPCPNTNFNLYTVGTTAASALAYTWQYLNNGVWTNVTGGNTSTITQNIPVPTTYRAIVTCTVSGLSDTTAAYQVNLASFYYCYCGSSGTYTGYSNNIGNVKLVTQPANVVTLNNGTATPLTFNTTANNLYTDFRYTVPAPTIYRDSTYKLFITQINDQYFYSGTAVAWIDFNRNGVFDAGEQVISGNVTNGTTQQISAQFTVPSNAGIGLTGLRVIDVQGTGAAVNPCGIYYYGETEDYLVNISYPPCNGPSSPGNALASTDTICVGYSINLTDTTHEYYRSGLSWDWQRTTNGGVTWTQMANSTGKDTLNNIVVTGPSSYRLRMVCNLTGDTTYSYLASVAIGASYQCYALSQAIGNNADSSDIGAFRIGNYVMPVGMSGGPHLRNPGAIYRRTDYTQYRNRIVLFADSTYHMSLYHIMRTPNHQDARVSVFIDFNNDLHYQALAGIYPFGPERIYTGLSTVNNWFLDTMVTMPDAVIPETPTGLRIVLNNDVNPNASANLGEGMYTSGETEDYVVIFHRPYPTGVGQTGIVKDMIMYPNPTGGKFTLDVRASKDIAHMDVTVSTITGQTVLSTSYDHTGTQFTTDLDLTGKASGVYFVEIRADGDKIVRKLVIR